MHYDLLGILIFSPDFTIKKMLVISVLPLQDLHSIIKLFSFHFYTVEFLLIFLKTLSLCCYIMSLYRQDFVFGCQK